MGSRVSQHILKGLSIFERARPAPAPARPARGQRAWDLGELNLLAVLRQVLRPLISSRFFMRIKYMYMHAERALLPLPFFFGDLSGASSSLSSHNTNISHAFGDTRCIVSAGRRGEAPLRRRRAGSSCLAASIPRPPSRA